MSLGNFATLPLATREETLGRIEKEITDKLVEGPRVYIDLLNEVTAEMRLSDITIACYALLRMTGSRVQMDNTVTPSVVSLIEAA